MNHPSVTNILNQIETKLISQKLSVIFVMRETVSSLLYALACDAYDLFSGRFEAPALSDIMMMLMQCLLTYQYSSVLLYIHNQITMLLPVVFGQQARSNDSELGVVIQSTINAIDYREQEGLVLYAIENNFDSILKDISSITIFLQQISNIRFETPYPETLLANINEAAEIYMQKKIFSLQTRTTSLCRSFYDENKDVNSFKKLQKMGGIAFKRVVKTPESRCHDLYQEIATFRCQDFDDDLDCSTVYSEGSRPTHFADSSTPSRHRISHYLT